MSELILEHYTVQAELLQESEADPLPEGVIARAKFSTASICEEKNGNGRIYPKSVFTKNMKAFMERCANGEVMMNADHPVAIGENLPTPAVAGHAVVAGILRKVTFNEGTNTLSLDQVDIPDTTAGRDVKAIMKAKGKIGVSSRGYGTSRDGKYKTADGRELEGKIINDDYFMESYDFVTKPSVKPAKVSEFRESEEPIKEQVMEITLESLTKENPALLKKIQEEAVALKKSELLEALKTKIADREKEIKAELQVEYLTKEKTFTKQLNENKLVIEALTKDKEMLANAESKTVKELNEKFDELNARVQHGEAIEWLTENAKGHTFGAEIIERCKDVKTVAEAQAQFESAKSLLDAASKKSAAMLEGKGFVKNPDAPITEEKNAPVVPAPVVNESVSKARRLAGVK